ncbi:unnamed protein product [Lepeophtheirus salmonis]|uniref:(salmon louse) hypothetical protein n=1 Tax=Lepeophtheirus salmonis TaxID=72036 RepID=A0A7R8H842_LEPSM|nr:unnamed protein product [Lepeophtheirus salmonis]CAF2915903.1 unnamed protein product [Lepeophtheirus salmonis]
MSGVNGGMQKIVQEILQREVPYVHCFKHHTQTSTAEVRMDTTGLFKAITQASFLFIAYMTHQVLSFLDLPKKWTPRQIHIPLYWYQTGPKSIGVLRSRDVILSFGELLSRETDHRTS